MSLAFMMMAIIIVSPLMMAFAQNEEIDYNVVQKSIEEEYAHTVLCEFGTYTTCRPCSDAAQYLHDIFDPDTLDFYFVTLVEDKSTIAHNRLYDDYNIYGFPMCYFDGGYEIGSGNPGGELVYRELIESCGQRVVSNLSMNVTLNWLEDAVFNVNVEIENNENETYNGRLRAYIVEIISRWNDYYTNPFRYAFLDWAFNKNISIDDGDTYYDAATWDGKEHGFSDIDWENIMVITAVFNDEWHQGYSWFPPNPAPFDAYYVDETVAAYFNTTPPNMPTITGPTCGKVGKSYDYTFNATDPDGDDIYYAIAWDWGQWAEWIGPYESGEEITLRHSWDEKGAHTIIARAMDVYEEVSDIATLEVTMPKNQQASNMWYLGWLERFPILQEILDVLRLNIR